ncbi:hypothetical protein EHQ12_04060 [Leptospira gomenensis]|uniref:Abasic site processing protein n=1 Tax=Leptospira gomenensis TaxID=2484974 RepID=A0A5F1YGZ9_9LEPT|nr:SOS response-associated peptidase family protein [Leptospira gomenensis]TGK36209.1 hypothetical protein EHQ17_04660 [Leptospira gomenensis]TGK42753.1 hypothetical protein EHQ07_13840 [Leptospira gomenensis]TGK42940.1 hypothetical protein EHQ12_04060 [Leptospira gomenensis]TGK54952.1 hypothetical protein EHQ13_18315 [Leptospira gomenensis]
MCNKFAQLVTKPDGTQHWIRPSYDAPTTLYDGKTHSDLMRKSEMKYPKNPVEVIYRAKSGIEKMNSFQWGRPLPDKSKVVNNTRIENITTHWSKYSDNRVLIPITHFQEYKEESGLRKPFNIWFNDFPIAYMAGLAGTHFPEDKNQEPIRWVSLITQEACSKMRLIHNSGDNRFRQPCLVKPSAWDFWLSDKHYGEETFFKLCQGYLSEEITAEEEEIPGSQMGLFTNPT